MCSFILCPIISAIPISVLPITQFGSAIISFCISCVIIGRFSCTAASFMNIRNTYHFTLCVIMFVRFIPYSAFFMLCFSSHSLTPTSYNSFFVIFSIVFDIIHPSISIIDAFIIMGMVFTVDSIILFIGALIVCSVSTIYFLLVG